MALKKILPALVLLGGIITTSALACDGVVGTAAPGEPCASGHTCVTCPSSGDTVHKVKNDNRCPGGNPSYVCCPDSGHAPVACCPGVSGGSCDGYP